MEDQVLKEVTRDAEDLEALEAEIAGPSTVLNAPGHWDFFISHTQQDDAAKLLASELWAELGRMGHKCWLDVKMNVCDQGAMEEGARNSGTLLAVVTDNDKVSYFSRPMCRQEIKWALDAKRRIVPVVRNEDKPRISAFIKEGERHGIDFSRYNFVHYDRSGPSRVKASIGDIVTQSQSTVKQRPNHS